MDEVTVPTGYTKAVAAPVAFYDEDGETVIGYTIDVTNTHVIPPKKTAYEYKTTTIINGKEVKPGQLLTYSIYYANTTGEEVDATITDDLPEYTTYVESDNNGSHSGGTVTWNVTVPNNAEVTVSVTVRVNADVSGEVLENKGVINQGEHGPTIETEPVRNPTPYKLVIAKDLKDFVDHQENLEEGAFNSATFVFEITGTYKDENGATQNYYNTIGMDFTKASDVHQEVTVEGIPSTIEGLKVKESYSGSYKPNNEEQTAVLQTSGDYKDKYLVEFENTKKDIKYKGGVVNNYDKDGYNGQSHKENDASGEVQG